MEFFKTLGDMNQVNGPIIIFRASSSKAWSIQICGIPYETLCSMFMLQLFESLCTQGETGHALLYVCPSKPFAVLTFTLQSARIL